MFSFTLFIDVQMTTLFIYFFSHFKSILNMHELRIRRTLLLTGIGGLIAQSLDEQLMRWIRAAELTCDRAALLVVQDPKVCIVKLLDWHICNMKFWCSVKLIILFYSMLLQEIVVSVLMKLCGGSPSLADKLNVDAFLEQARSYDKASSSPMGWYIR